MGRVAEARASPPRASRSTPRARFRFSYARRARSMPSPPTHPPERQAEQLAGRQARRAAGRQTAGKRTTYTEKLLQAQGLRG